MKAKTIVHFDCDWDTDNQVRMLHRALAGSGVTLRALRQALWSLGLEVDHARIIERAQTFARDLGRPPDVPYYTVGMPTANASIVPKRKNAAWQALDRRNAKLQQQKK